VHLVGFFFIKWLPFIFIYEKKNYCTSMPYFTNFYELLRVQQVTELFIGTVIFKQELQTLLLVMSKCAFFLTSSINVITQPNVTTHTNDIPLQNTDRKPKFMDLRVLYTSIRKSWLKAHVDAVFWRVCGLEVCIIPRKQTESLFILVAT